MRRHLSWLIALGLAVSMSGIAAGHDSSVDGVSEDQKSGPRNGVRSTNDGVIDTPVEVHALHDHDDQHGGMDGHIAPTQENVDVVGTWTAPRSNKKPGRITDVWSHEGYAYLGTFAPPCSGLGVNIVNISDPTDPHKQGFISSRPGTRVNDVKVFSFDELASGFSGDILLHSNENCSAHPQRVGGISLWDVTKPGKAKVLAEGVGDTTNDAGDPLPRARQVHNIFAWQDGDQAYAAIVDDEELRDVDILDITDPANPVHIAETGLPDWPTVNVDGFGDNAFVHDIWAMDTPGGWELLLSYWDAGWIRLDVSDPTSPMIVDPPGDSDYPNPDPLVLAATGKALQPEGNAHAAAWSEDGSLILAGDEDFSPYRLTPITVTGTTGPGQPAVGTEYDAGEFGWTVPITNIPDGILNGPVAFGGYACDESAPVPPASVLDPFLDPGEERILVTQRGPVGDPADTYPGCFFSIKVENGQDAGYDAVIIANHHTGAGGGASPDAFICGSAGHTFAVTAHGLCTGHRAMHELFATPASYATDYTGEVAPGLGDVGAEIEVSSSFDGWGPFHLIDNDSMEELDAWAPSEAHDEDFAQGFGDLTMHNIEYYGSDKAVISWYSLGLRVLDYGDCTAAPDGDFTNQDDPGCVQEVGRFIDEGGNNFWGVHVDEDTGLILASDRDRGLYIFDFTG